MSGMYTEEIARGAAFLDKHRPGWRERINVDLLRMSGCTTCVLGQLAGGHEVMWGSVLCYFGIDDEGDADYDMGFNIYSMTDEPAHEWEQLTEEWREYICSTRSTVSA